VHARLAIAGNEGVSALHEQHSRTALYLAAEHGHAPVLTALLAAGADADALATVQTAQAHTRTSPLWAARRGEHAEAVEVLVAAGALELAETLATADAPPDGTSTSRGVPVLV
jgi:hypothetical protein